MARSAANVKGVSDTEIRLLHRVTPVRVKFLDELRTYLEPIGKRDLDAFVALKHEEHTKHALPIDDNLYIWDFR